MEQGRALLPVATREAGGDNRSDPRGSFYYARATRASWTIGRLRIALVAAHLAFAGLLVIATPMLKELLVMPLAPPPRSWLSEEEVWLQERYRWKEKRHQPQRHPRACALRLCCWSGLGRGGCE